MIEVSGVVKDFKISKGLFRGKDVLRAVDDVSLTIESGDVLGRCRIRRMGALQFKGGHW